jgi:hypothetical protein
MAEWTGTHGAQHHPAGLAPLAEGQPDRRAIAVLLIPRTARLLADRSIGKQFRAWPEPDLEVGLQGRFLQHRHTAVRRKTCSRKYARFSPQWNQQLAH